MAVYYKFKSAKDYDSIPIEGQFISVGNLKERIFESKNLGGGTDFDLMVTNAQNNEEYVDEAAMIPKNTSVLIRRIPGRPRKPIVTEREEPKVVEDKVEELPPQSSGMFSGDASTMRYPEESEWDEFGNDLYAIPDVLPAQPSNPVVDVTPASKIDEENKLKALIDTSAIDWNRQGQDSYGGGRGFGRGMGGRMMAGRGFGRGGFERKTPPAGYICHRCKVPGHFIQHCPTNGDPNYNIRKVKPPTGIPKSMLMAASDGSYALPSGAAAVLKPNEAAFEKEIEGLPTSRPINDLPPELRCPLCKEVMKDAVLTSKCCFRSFCDKCIRDYIITKPMCVCGATNILADDLLPNKTLRETISRILESTTSSAENAGSFVQVPDMESARPAQPKIPSPTLSVASKDEPKLPPRIDNSSDLKVAEVKDGSGHSEGKAVNVVMHSANMKTAKKTDPFEAPESMSNKEPISAESAPVPDEVQEKMVAGEQAKKKKKKKTRVPSSAADMQWRAFQDFGAENYSGMQMAPSAYNPFWGGGMQMGMDGYMAPFGAAMPYMGFAPGPFDVPFGGMMPQDPFAAQGYMMPPVPPRDLAELGINSMGMNHGHQVMSREEFEARKAEARRKFEFERLNERERMREGRGIGREVNSSSLADGPSTKAKPQRPMPSSQPDRFDRAEKTSSRLDRYSPARRSPTRPPPPKRRSIDRDEGGASAAAGDDRKHKGSVFSRISFARPGEGGETKKRKKTPPMDAGLANGGGSKDQKQQHHHHHHRREEPAAHRSSSSSVAVANGGYKRYEKEYSSEDEEEERHFKRKPSSSSRREEREREREEASGRHSSTRASRERDHRGHERLESKRR